ncbi:mitochondrial assembly of ribosomal large subunit protein 1 [Teleopsis dalmanni]|uniref:mitochondrial assembly of ribosomal large subunit protein 1 n=1 Tax=Teleopsis dalmanni TaxID=139649 RepID=UPI0018CD5DB3|nr:mitochondrial assembly of ribosomal large subunit protein 1 [Teleopsis dalmanni]
MNGLRLFRLVRDKRLSAPFLRCFHHEFTQPDPKKTVADNSKQESTSQKLSEEIISGAVRQKYTVFRDEDAVEIFDVEEERNRYQQKDKSEHMIVDDYMGLNLKRGVTGVFDIEDLVDVLRKENAEDIFVCSVPKELKYVDYMVVCNGRSYRHMIATAEFVRRMFKVKREKNDLIPKIEGEKSRDWMAIDLGNIALHIFSPTAREEYDIESLWAVGAEYDKEYNKPEDVLVKMFEDHAILLADLESK